MKLVVLIAIASAGCGSGAPRAQPTAIGEPGPGACVERYDDASAERASDAATATLTTLIAAARVGDRSAVANAVDGDRSVPSARSDELAALLVTLPAGCAPIWYAQPGRFAVQPRLEGEPIDEPREAHALLIDAADHLVATCDRGCAVIAIALTPSSGRVVDWGPIDQRPGTMH